MTHASFKKSVLLLGIFLTAIVFTVSGLTSENPNEVDAGTVIEQNNTEPYEVTVTYSNAGTADHLTVTGPNKTNQTLPGAGDTTTVTNLSIGDTVTVYAVDGTRSHEEQRQTRIMTYTVTNQSEPDDFFF